MEILQERRIWCQCSRRRMGETIDLTIDSSALPVGVASAVGMQDLERDPPEYIAANAASEW